MFFRLDDMASGATVMLQWRGLALVAAVPLPRAPAEIEDSLHVHGLPCFVVQQD